MRMWLSCSLWSAIELFLTSLISTGFHHSVFGDEEAGAERSFVFCFFGALGNARAKERMQF